MEKPTKKTEGSKGKVTKARIINFKSCVAKRQSVKDAKAIKKIIAYADKLNW